MSDVMAGYLVIFGGFIAFLIGLFLFFCFLSWIQEHILGFISIMLVLIFLAVVF
jgi:hypothetical protein